MFHRARLRLANWIERVSARLMAWLRDDKPHGVLHVYHEGKTNQWVLADDRGPIVRTPGFKEAWAMLEYHSLKAKRKVDLTHVHSR